MYGGCGLLTAATLTPASDKLSKATAHRVMDGPANGGREEKMGEGGRADCDDQILPPSCLLLY